MRPTSWETATVVAIRRETVRAKTFRLALRDPVRHLAGQHYVVRLTAPDGYTASRSYSVASAPDGSREFELTVERLEEGEVSSFLHDVVEVGDVLEVRGPIGRYFVWDGTTPAVLIGGGSGVVPLMAMLRVARRDRRPDLVRLLVSVRTPADLYYADELPGPESTVVYTQLAPFTTRSPARLTKGDVASAIMDEPEMMDSTAYVCGSTGFADAATDILQEMGFSIEQIRVERFGPSG
ncbi:MAG TPA: FAD-binding oxidoreductase [Acidimicrobiales bacterium]